MCTQAECIWLHLDIIKKCIQKNKKIFKNVSYAYTTIPSYPSGQIGFLLCSDVQTCSTPARTVADAMTGEAAGAFRHTKWTKLQCHFILLSNHPSPVTDGLRYYSEEIHRAAFILPKFAQDYVFSE